MKKNYAFVLMALVLFGATSISFAQNVEVAGKVTGIRGIALRTYCSFSTLFGANNDKCFDLTKTGAINAAAIGAVDLGVGSETPSGTGTPQGNPTTPGINSPVVERTVVVQGAPGPQGPQGPAGSTGPAPTFPNMPLVFWSGGGAGGGSTQTIVNNSISPLPGGALPGQVLSTNASGTAEWQFVTLPGTTSTPSILGSLTDLSATNGLNLATTSTSTTLKLGGSLTEDTTILQDVFNFGLNRLGFGFFNQGTTTVPGASTSTENTTFTGLSGTEGTQNIFAGLFRRATSLFPIYEVRAFDSATNKEGYSTVESGGIETGVTNGTSTAELSIDVSEVQISAFDSASSTGIKVTATGGVEFNSSEGGYSFPRMDGTTNTLLTTNGAGQLRYETISNIIGTSSTSTINAWGLNGNSGIDDTVNFFGTTDAQDVVIKTNNIERARFAANGNFSLFTNDQNTTSAITVKGIHSDGRWGIFDEANNKLLQNRSDAGILGFGTGDFVSYGFNSAMGIRGADVHIPHLVVGGNHTGPNNISQLRMEASSQTEYNYAGSYPTGVNTYKISTILHAPLPGNVRAPILIGGRELKFVTGANDTGTPEMTITENGNIGVGTVLPSTRFEVNSGVANDSGFAFSQLNATSTLVGTALNFLTVDALGKVVLSGLDPSTFATTSAAGITGNIQFNEGGLFAANSNFNWDNVNNRFSIQGTSTQSANLTEWKNSAGTNVLSVNPNGGMNMAYQQALTFAFGGSVGNTGGVGGAVELLAESGGGVSGIRVEFGNRIQLLGGNMSVFPQNNTSNSITLRGADNGNVGNGGDLILRGGNATLTSGMGGLATFKSGDSIGTNMSGTNAVLAGGAATGNAVGGSLLFQTSDVGASGSALQPFTTKMALTADGRLGIGTTSPARQLHVAINTTGQVARFQNSSATCNINPSIFLAFNCLSDQSLKKDIVSLDSKLAAFTKLNPVNYHWNTEEVGSPLQYGFIAQEVEAVFPDFVTTDSETGLKSVAFGNLIPLTVKAVSEINAHLGDLSEETTPEKFAQSTIFKRFTDAFKTLTLAFKDITADKATIKELCLPKSDGTVICLSGDQVAQIAASAGIQTVTPAPVPVVVVDPTPVPVVEEEPVVPPTDEPVDPIVEEVIPVVQVESTPVVVEPVTPVVQDVPTAVIVPEQVSTPAPTTPPTPTE